MSYVIWCHPASSVTGSMWREPPKEARLLQKSQKCSGTINFVANVKISFNGLLVPSQNLLNTDKTILITTWTFHSIRTWICLFCKRRCPSLKSNLGARFRHIVRILFFLQKIYISQQVNVFIHTLVFYSLKLNHFNKNFKYYLF